MSAQGFLDWQSCKDGGNVLAAACAGRDLEAYHFPLSGCLGTWPPRYLRPHLFGVARSDGEDEYNEDGVNLTDIRLCLALTVTQRIQRLAQMQREIVQWAQ